MDKKNKIIIYAISCFIASIVLHLYSFQVYNYMTSPFSFVIILIPSLIGAYFFKDEEVGSLQKDWIVNTLIGLLITLWPTIGIVLVLKNFYSFIN